MMPKDLNSLYIALVFFVPGLIIGRALGHLSPRDKVEGLEFMLQSLTYGAINLAIWGLLYYQLAISKLFDEKLLLFGFFFIVLTFIGPFITASLIHFGSLFIRWFGGKIGLKISDSIPSAWDSIFSQAAKPFFIVIHTKNDEIIRGRFASPGRAGDFNSGHDLYLSVLYDAKGKIITGGAGIYIPGDEIKYFQIIAK